MELGGKPPPRHLFLEGTETNMLGFELGAGRFSMPVSSENMMADPYDVCYNSVQCSCVRVVSSARVGKLGGSTLKGPRTQQIRLPSFLDAFTELEEPRTEDATSPASPSLNRWLLSSPHTFSCGTPFSSSGDWICMHQGLISCLKSFLW